MKKNIILLLALILNTFLFAQIGINNNNPQGVFHVDAAKNNPKNGTAPNKDEHSDDFVISSTGVVSIGTIDPSPYSALEIESSKGVRLPQLTEDQISTLDAISSDDVTKKDGLIFFNKTTNCLSYWANGWKKLCGVDAQSSCTPVTGSLTITPSSVNINTDQDQVFTAQGVANATSYEWKLNNEVVQNTSSNTYVLNTLTEGTYTLSVTAYGGCDSMITSTASANATSNVTFKCTQAGRFFKAGTNCLTYNFCTKMANGTFVMQTYDCPSGSKFDYKRRLCTTDNPAPCPF